MDKYKIILVDDHQLFRKGIALIINNMSDFEVIAEANDGLEFLNLLQNHNPDIVMMDIKMPKIDGVEATKRALKIQPNLKIIALSMFGNVEYYNQMLEAGVKGFVLKDSEMEELNSALRNVIQNKNYFSQELLLNLVNNYQTPNQKDTVSFTNREIEILQLICQGYSNSEIANKLFLSQRTVETHRANLLEKTDAKNSIQLVVFAIKNNLSKI